MRTMSVVKIFHISYAHHLPDYDGPCAEVHGHNAKIEVEFTRNEQQFDNGSSYPGMLLDFRDIKAIVQPWIDKLDHQYLNKLSIVAIPQLDPPTAEKMCLWLRNKIVIENAQVGLWLSRIRVWETEDAYAEWRRDG